MDIKLQATDPPKKLFLENKVLKFNIIKIFYRQGDCKRPQIQFIQIAKINLHWQKKKMMTILVDKAKSIKWKTNDRFYH